MIHFRWLGVSLVILLCCSFASAEDSPGVTASFLVMQEFPGANLPPGLAAQQDHDGYSISSSQINGHPQVGLVGKSGPLGASGEHLFLTPRFLCGFAVSALLP